MTFSIVARCARTGRFASAVASSSPAVAARCAYARAGVGAATTQNITDPPAGTARTGPDGARRRRGAGVCRIGSGGAARGSDGKLTMIDAAGRTACFSGGHVLGCHGSASGIDVVSAGNLLANKGVPGQSLTHSRHPQGSI